MTEFTCSANDPLGKIMLFIGSAVAKEDKKKPKSFRNKTITNQMFVWIHDYQWYCTDGYRLHFTHDFELPELEDGPYDVVKSKSSVTIKRNPIEIFMPLHMDDIIDATKKHIEIADIEPVRGYNELSILSRLLYPVFKKEIYLNGEYVEPLVKYSQNWKIKIASEQAWKNAVRFDADFVSAIIMPEIL